MRLLWVFSTFAVGGPQRRFATLAAALGPEHEHIIAAMDGDHEAAGLLGGDVQFRLLPLTVEKGGFVSRANIHRFDDILKAEKPDLLLTSNWGAIEWHLANRGRAPHIHFEDGFGPDESGGKRDWKRDMARRAFFGFGKANAFVAPSSGIAELMHTAWGVPAARIRQIPNGVDCARFTVAPRGDRTPVTVGSVGALRPEKRFDRLIRVFAAAGDNLRLLIVGDGPERAALETLAAELGVADRTVFAGAQDDVAPFLSQMDVYALTSDTEQMPISLVEAMAAGLPAVASDVGDVKAMLAPENAILVFDREDEAALAEAVAALAGDAERRLDLGARNAEKARAAYSLGAMVAAYRSLIADVAGA